MQKLKADSNVCNTEIVCKHEKILGVAERVGFESASCLETKESCGAPWPSKELKGKGGSLVPPIAPEYFESNSGYSVAMRFPRGSTSLK